MVDDKSVPVCTLQIGDTYGVVIESYLEGKIESHELTLYNNMRKDPFPVTFYSRIKYAKNDIVEDAYFGATDESLSNATFFIGSTPFFTSEKLYHTFMKIDTQIFMKLCQNTLIEKYGIKDDWLIYQITDSDRKEFYKEYSNENECISAENYIKYFYVSRSIFNCLAAKKESLSIDDYNFPEFPTLLLRCNWIKELELYQLLISELPEGITNITGLNKLSLELRFLKKLPFTISRLKNLQRLKVICTSISGLPESLSELTELNEFHIAENEKLNSFPVIITQLKNLEYLYAYSNNIDDLPGELYRLVSLKVLDLSDNKIEHLPAKISLLNSLEVLNLKGNRLQDIPDDLFEMNNLEEVNLSENITLAKERVYTLLMKSGRRDKIDLVI